jgi:hypothetical protein
LTKLAEVGFLNREKRGNQQVYSANTTGPIFSELASILRKTSGLADVLAQALQPAAKQLQIALCLAPWHKAVRRRTATLT